MGSIWQDGLEKPTFEPLKGDCRTDVLIIGGGLTGILCGHALKQAGVNCRIVEARTVCGGVTEHTTAKITWHHGAIFDRMIKRYGVSRARLYVKANEEALEGDPRLEGMYVDEAEHGLSFRQYGDLLLLGGGGHRTGKSGGGWQELAGFASTHYPTAREVCRFATQDCKSLDDLPYIGRYARSTPSWYVATGYNKWGMTTAMVAARLLTDLVMGKESPYEALFSPSRSLLRTQLFVNAGETVVSLLTPTVPRCTHLGCALTYNKQEHSWDCPCHGSPFTEDGRVINNPATRELNRKRK